MIALLTPLASLLALAAPQDVVLRGVLDDEPVSVSQDGGRVPIPAATVTLQIYDVLDLVEPRPTGAIGADRSQPTERVAVPSPHEWDEATKRANELTAAAELAQRRMRNLEELAQVVADYMNPPFAASVGHSVRAAGEGSLVVNASPEQHTWLQSFLERQRRHVDTIYHLEFRVIEMTDGAWEDLRPADGAVVLESKEEVAAFLLGVEADPRASLVTSPALTVFGRQSANMSALNQTAYVADFKLYENVQPGGTTIVDPVIDLVSYGLVIDSRVVHLSDTTISVEFQIELSELIEMGSAQTQFGEIGLPEIEKQTVRSTAYLKDGDTILFGGLTSDGDTTAVALRLNVVPAQRR